MNEDKEIDRAPIEGVVLDDHEAIERLCGAMIESTTEFDWDGQYELPEDLRDGLRAWVGEFIAWDRSTR